MRTGTPEYDVEPDGLDLDAMFGRLEYRVRVRTPGPGADAAIRSARRRRTTRTGLAVALVVAIGVAGIPLISGAIDARRSRTPIAGTSSSPPANPTPSASPTSPDVFVGGQQGPLHDALLAVAEIPFQPEGAFNRFDVDLHDSWMDGCGLRALAPADDTEESVVFTADGTDVEIEQYVRLLGSVDAARMWRDGAVAAWEACLGDAGHFVVSRVTPLDAAGYSAVVWLARAAPTSGAGLGIRLFAAGQAGTAVTAIRLDVPSVENLDSTVQAFATMVTTAMHKLTAAS